MKLNFETFFSELILHPFNADKKSDQYKAFTASIILGIFTVGLCHAYCAVKRHYKHKSSDSITSEEKNVDQVGSKILQTSKSASAPTNHPELSPTITAEQLKLFSAAEDKLKFCKENSIDVNAHTPGGFTLLYILCRKNDIKGIRSLMADPSLDINKLAPKTNISAIEFLFTYNIDLAEDCDYTEARSLVLSCPKVNPNQLWKNGRSFVCNLEEFDTDKRTNHLEDLLNSMDTTEIDFSLFGSNHAFSSSKLLELMSDETFNNLSSKFITLQRAIEFNELELIDVILKKIDLKSLSKSNLDDLSFTSASKGNLTVLKKIKDLKQLDFAQLVDHTDNTLLHHAVSSENNVDMVNWLLKQKIDINSINGLGDTALSIALKHGYEEIADAILNNPETNELLKNSKKEKITLFHEAVSGKNMNLINTLSRHFPLDKFNSIQLGNLLCIAIEAGNKSLVDQLLANNKNKLDINYKDENGNTPLHYAVASSRTDIVRTLLKNSSIQSNLGDQFGDPPIFLAARLGNFEIAEELLAHDPESLKIRNPHNNTILHNLHNLKMVKWIVEQSGYDLDLINTQSTIDPSSGVGNFTPIHSLVRMVLELIGQEQDKEDLQSYYETIEYLASIQGINLDTEAHVGIIRSPTTLRNDLIAIDLTIP